MDLICNLVQINLLIYSFPFPPLAESPRAFSKSNWVDLIISFMLAVILLWFSYWWLYCCRLESRRWQSEIQLQCAYGGQLLSANCTQLHTAGSMCWITSASVHFVQHVSKRRYMCALSGLLSSDLLHYWSDLHEPFTVAKTVDVRCQQRWKCFSGRKLLLPAVINVQSKCPLVPLKGPLCPLSFVMASLFRNQLLCRRLEV